MHRFPALPAVALAVLALVLAGGEPCRGWLIDQRSRRWSLEGDEVVLLLCTPRLRRFALGRVERIYLATAEPRGSC